MYQLWLAAHGRIPATLSITADTGGEFDRVCSTGERMTAKTFFERYVKPFGDAHGIETLFVRTLDEDGNNLPDLGEVLKASAAHADEGFDVMVKGQCVPLFTNDRSRGRLRQSCTDKWKVRAINQEARRRGITVLRNAIGFHAAEAHRIKARFLCDEGGFSIYKPQYTRQGVTRDIRWLEHYYPLIDLQLNRDQIRAQLVKAGLPYLVTTECDFCPHQDYARWIMHTPEVINNLATLEAGWKGKLFFTSKRIPLKEAIEEMRLEALRKAANQELPGFGCENGAYCGI